jgi:hypothetical protein
LEGGVLEFALMEPIREFTEKVEGYRIHRVKQNEVGFLDLLAVQYYGIGYEKLWWVIAYANAMIDPESEMYPGLALLIPPRTAVIQFLSRRGNAST